MDIVILLGVSSIASFFIGAIIGEIYGVKKGVDYCMDRYAEDLKKELGIDDDPMEKAKQNAKRNTLRRIK